jgi:hypothetical protein
MLGEDAPNAFDRKDVGKGQLRLRQEGVDDSLKTAAVEIAGIW